jgi:hypothetical protein
MQSSTNNGVKIIVVKKKSKGKDKATPYKPGQALRVPGG